MVFTQGALSREAGFEYHDPRNYYVNNLQGNNFAIVIVTWQPKYFSKKKLFMQL